MKKETITRVNDIDCLISKRLKSKRLTLGLSQEVLGKAAGVSTQQLQKYENGLNRISSGKLFMLSTFFKVPINYFFEQEDNLSNNISNLLSEKKDHISEKELIILIKAFSKITDTIKRKKIIELVKTMH
jgi:transcriptional regulator with XRE-family HTH domain